MILTVVAWHQALVFYWVIISFIVLTPGQLINSVFLGSHRSKLFFIVSCPPHVGTHIWGGSEGGPDLCDDLNKRRMQKFLRLLAGVYMRAKKLKFIAPVLHLFCTVSFNFFLSKMPHSNIFYIEAKKFS